MKRSAGLLLVALALSVTGVACGGRWVPQTSPTVAFSDDAAAYDRVIGWLRSSGYDIDRQDDARKFVRVKAKLDGDVVLQPTAGGFGPPKAVKRESYFGIQVDATGNVTITPSGYHVRPEDGGVMHRDLAAELDSLVNGLVGAGGKSAAGRAI